MLGSREYQTMSSALGFQEVMDRMDGNSEGESPQNKHQAERRRFAPLPQALGHGNGHEHEEYEGQRRPSHRR
jgi:hypothetical protein